jgi:hypothetical protein
MVKSFLEGGFHLFGRRSRNNLRRHDVQMLFEPADLVPMPALKCVRNDLRQVTIGRHMRGTRLGFELGSVLIG